MTISIGKLIAILGGWSVFIGGLAGWIGHLMSKRLEVKWKGDQQKEVESAKEELSRGRLLLETALSNFSSGRAAAQERRLDALERAWEATLDVKEICSESIFFYRILVPEEYNELHTDHKVAEMVDELDNQTLMELSKSTSDVEALRPLIGETVWTLFYIYRAFVGRITHFLVEGKKGEDIPDWREDDGVNQLLSVVLTEEELEAAFEIEIHALDYVLNRLEEKIIEEINMTLSGRRSSVESMKHARKLKKALEGISPTGDHYA